MPSVPAANDNLIERTRQLWDPRLGRELSVQDARHIIENATGFFTVVADWSRADKGAANDNAAPSIEPDGGERRES